MYVSQMNFSFTNMGSKVYRKWKWDKDLQKCFILELKIDFIFRQPTIVTNPGYTTDETSTSALLRKRPRSPVNTSPNLLSPEPKRKSKEWDNNKIVLTPGSSSANIPLTGHLDLMSTAQPTFFYDISGLYSYYQQS